MRKPRGLTLIEIVISLLIVTILSGVIIGAYSLTLKVCRENLDISTMRTQMLVALEQLTADLKKAHSVTEVSNGEIDFVVDSTTYYISYYNTGSSYELRKSFSTGGDGSGALLAGNLVAPTADSFIYASNLVTIWLSGALNNETIEMRTAVRPRRM